MLPAWGSSAARVSTPIAYESLSRWEPGQPVDINRLPHQVTGAAVLITTVFLAAAVPVIGEALDKPVIVATRFNSENQTVGQTGEPLMGRVSRGGMSQSGGVL